MLYQYQAADDGEIIEIEKDASKGGGDFVVVGGKRYERVFSSCVGAKVHRMVEGYPRVSHSACRNIEGADCTKAGKPIITSRRHEREFAARHDMAIDALD